MNEEKRQAIKKEKAERQQTQMDMLTGIVDNESKTYTFSKKIHVNGGEAKEGTFKAKYLGVAARLRIGTIRAKLLDGAPSDSVDRLTDDIAFMMSYLSVALVETPKWWNLDAVDDYDELRDMYMEVYNFVNSFRQSNESAADDGNSGDATGA